MYRDERSADSHGMVAVGRYLWSADRAGNNIEIIDTVTNHGFDLTPHMLLYHINLGWPLVDEGSRLVAPIARTLFATVSSWR